jgi:uncharacterized protein YndB with AHSA1/START domain
MNEFEQSITVSRAPEKVFAVISNIEKMPEYLPVFRRIERQSGEDRVRAEGEIMGYRFTQTGFFRADDERRRVEFGADDPALSTGWIQVTQGPDLSAADVTVHLSLQIRPEQEEMVRARFRNLDEMIGDGLRRALQALKNYCEGHGDPLDEADLAVPA